MKYLVFLLTFFIVFSLGLVQSIQAAAPASTVPKTIFSYSPNSRRFSVTVKNVTGKVTYAIEYKRSSKTGDVIEGLQRSGKAKNKIFSGTAYAGTQSGRYFVPHNVKSGVIDIKATDLSGNLYIYRANFVVNKGKVKITAL